MQGDKGRQAGRIDVHHHVLPAFYIEAQRAAGFTATAYRGFPDWTPEMSLALMDRHRIATAILSFSTPGIWFGDAAQTRDLARQSNEYIAGLMRAQPDRFGGFGVLPLPDIEASVAELDYALDALGLDGVRLLTSVGQRYIGHPDFEPLYAALDRRKALVFIHPSYPPGTEAEGWDIPRMMIDYPFETTRVATNLIMNGVMARHPDIRFVLSHAGGALPFLAHRIAIFDRMTPQRDNYPEGAIAYMKRFWYDTALSGDAVPLAALNGLVDPSRILFGTDYPYVSEEVVAAETAGFEAHHGLDAAGLARVERGNAEALLPRLAAAQAAP